MFLALEGGGFFSSSASGYSKGLTLLLLGKKNEEKPMRVSPLNQCQLVDRESDSDLQLASTNNRVVRGCASVVCFGCAAAGLESPSPLKVGPAIQTDVLIEPPVFDDIQSKDDVDNEEGQVLKTCLKSSLKRPAVIGTELEASGEKHFNTEKRKVQWTDVSGGDLAEIREFELSDVDESDDEYGNGKGKSCSCTIM
ncbi:uncharacterized protein LOC124928008 [Impatiens glandulifera]|uniref:uncharacterized protein LOC124928008 n=1 Tax=Impatiens glandulifera TaxID=253017 RepID=UPI001FB0F590|nr:uncharacterized protein LOC124928008 [Impatiens glandulifera]XP_047324483.1 uncharacterized protein LOC124928008 [Impatiens glandulifera]XP_047324484.1 uncharacterized protein LOC124928008 [Impatiens glandulifera]XP_047324485.1 uncharacterized protein LOC124928008 [Impatiens glandulifera]XP_047324486.1 uncharacterized protein LOC124928008 [Impatiens glandulifera]